MILDTWSPVLRWQDMIRPGISKKHYPIRNLFLPYSEVWFPGWDSLLNSMDHIQTSCTPQRLWFRLVNHDVDNGWDFSPSANQHFLSLLKSCNNLEEFKQAHVQIIRWGFFWNSFCASNLVAACALSD
ncbi:hypothetical protein V6N13_139995 [Hibiscus sabdariffa]